MSNFQQIAVSGNLTGEAKTITRKDGSVFYTATIAVNRSTKKGEDAPPTYFDFFPREEDLEGIKNAVANKAPVFLTGEVQSRAYPKKDGTPGASIEVRYARLGFGDAITAVVRGTVSRAGRVVDGANGSFIALDVKVEQNGKTQYVSCTGDGERFANVVPYLNEGRQVVLTGIPLAKAYDKKDGGGAGASLNLLLNNLRLGKGPQTDGATVEADVPVGADGVDMDEVPF